jgi:hypothetical protein
MNPKLIKLSLLLISLLALFPARTALADTGPKPSMDFQFTQEMTGEPPVAITSGVLYECDQPDCSDGAPIEEVGPQGFRCEVNSCSAVAYGFAPYHWIAIEFSDGKTRHSHVFETAGFESKYTVTIRPDDLLVEARFNPGFLTRTAAILIACICAILGVGIVVGLTMYLTRRSKKN